jgi:hypothetical protein
LAILPGGSARGLSVALRAYRPGVVDVPMLPQHGRIVLVMLQDGRQLEGSV